MIETHITVNGADILVRDLDPADMLDLIEAAGQNAGNRAWLRFAMLACAVRSIDGVPVPFPRDASGIKALARRLGSDVLEAVRNALFSDDTSSQVEAAKN